ncbi:MAG: lamin tail domain-containing protein, partial [Paludibacteraceae bacterium]|nr:lamin tail domain-containing protein [Paludibacteraceae bacterium]
MGKKFFDFWSAPKWTFLLLSGWVGQSQAGVTITEVMQSNFGGVLDYYNEFPDSWVEIYNSGEKDVDLNGFSIGELNDLDSAYVIQESFVVPADGYFLIYCDKENLRQHTHFRLNSDKPGALYLWDDQGVLLDSMHYPEMISPEVSWGRLPDNPDSLSHFRIATPEQRNNNTNTERVMKKVDFSVDGGVKKEPFYLNLTLKGDYPEDAVIRYTTDGSEPTSKSQIFFDSLYLYIQKNTVVRAKPFSDSAISKISKTQTYIFDRDDKMPIISVVGDYSHLYGSALGIFSSSTTYGDHHPDNPSPRDWMGHQNYLYNWRRPINIEYFSADSLDPDFNQLSETRVAGNVSREYSIKSMVVYANKRFGDKHFNGVFWKNLKPNCKKQKSMTIRTSNDDLYSINDMLSQTAIGRFAKYYDVDYQAKRNVQLYINGKFQRIMHLQERDGDDFVWANHNKITDIEIIETDDGLGTNRVSEELFPNYVHFKSTYGSNKCTYQ